MKRIPEIYWDQNYLIPPTTIQKAWVQRWLELLDPNTSYIFAPTGINIIRILEEILNSPDKGRTRTRFLLLTELKQHLDKLSTLFQDFSFPSIDSFQQMHALSEEISIKVDNLLHYAELVFDTNGCEKESCQEAMREFKNLYDVSFLNNIEVLLTFLKEENRYLHILCEALEFKLDAMIEFSGDLDYLSSSLIVELLNADRFSPSFLKTTCVNTFLRSGEHSFQLRLTNYLMTFKRKLHTFTVYMRVQAKKTLLNVQQINEISFHESIPHILGQIEISRSQERLNPQQEKHAKNFFFYGEPTDNLIFATLQGVRTEDAGSAAIHALSKLNSALQQAQFEYEVSGFSIDKRIYVYNQSTNSFSFLSQKQLSQAKHGSIGNPYRLEKLATWLSYIDHLYSSKKKQDEDIVMKRIVKNLSNTALSWHQGALQANTSETQFLNHWISLEHIFEPIDTPINCKKSASDKAVLALAQKLSDHYFTQWVLSIWGDMKRLNMFGTPRLIAPTDGQVKFSEELLGMRSQDNLIIVPLDSKIVPELILETNENRAKSFRILPGTILFVKDGEKVQQGQWLAGAYLFSNENSQLAPLFKGLSPRKENLLYLALYIFNVGLVNLGEVRLEQLQPIFRAWKEYKRTPGILVSGIRWFDRLERLIIDIKHFTNLFYYDSHLSLADIYRFLDTLPDLVKISFNRAPLNIQKRLRITSQEYSDQKAFLPIYNSLSKLENNLSLDKLPDDVLFEIFKDQAPLPGTWLDIFAKEFIAIKTDQPLMQYRMKSFQEMCLTCNTKRLELDFFCQMDRLRRTRNYLVHEAQAPDNLNMLTLQLYKYARIYLREAIYATASYPHSAPENILF